MPTPTVVPLRESAYKSFTLFACHFRSAKNGNFSRMIVWWWEMVQIDCRVMHIFLTLMSHIKVSGEQTWGSVKQIVTVRISTRDSRSLKTVMKSFQDIKWKSYSVMEFSQTNRTFCEVFLFQIFDNKTNSIF